MKSNHGRRDWTKNTSALCFSGKLDINKIYCLRFTSSAYQTGVYVWFGLTFKPKKVTSILFIFCLPMVYKEITLVIHCLNQWLRNLYQLRFDRMQTRVHKSGASHEKHIKGLLLLASLKNLKRVDCFNMLILF